MSGARTRHRSSDVRSASTGMRLRMPVATLLMKGSPPAVGRVLRSPHPCRSGVRLAPPFPESRCEADRRRDRVYRGERCTA